MTVDYRKLLKDTLRGSLIDSDDVPVPIGGWDDDDSTVLSEVEVRAFEEVLLELKAEAIADGIKHGHPSTTAEQAIDAAVRQAAGLEDEP